MEVRVIVDNGEIHYGNLQRRSSKEKAGPTVGPYGVNDEKVYK